MLPHSPTPSNPPVFIVGRPRSGTTLAAAIVDSMPGTAVHPVESKLFTNWLPAFGEDLEDKERLDAILTAFTSDRDFFKRLIAAGELRRRMEARHPRRITDLLEVVCAHYAETTGKPRWGEKTPIHYRHLDRIRAAWPSSLLILTVRDPRAVFASLLLRNFGLRDPLDNAREWLHYMTIVERHRNDPGAFILQYERLARAPRDVVGELCSFLGEPFEDRLLGARTDPLPASDESPASRRTRERAMQPVDTSSLDLWRKQLTPRQVRIIEHAAGPVMERWGYERTTGGLTAGDRVVVFVRDRFRPALNVLRRARRRINRTPLPDAAPE